MSIFRKLFNSKGEELPDPTPIDIPVELRARDTLKDKIDAVLRSEQWSAMMREKGIETYDEANDFDVDEDGKESSNYEERDGSFDYAYAEEHSKKMRDDGEMRERYEKTERAIQDHAIRVKTAQELKKVANTVPEVKKHE